jgi:hypothetical protein
MVNSMNYSDSPGTERRAHGHGMGLTGWAIKNAETGLYILYVLSVLLMLGCYFLNLPPGREEFYRHTLLMWEAVAKFLSRGTGH